MIFSVMSKEGDSLQALTRTVWRRLVVGVEILKTWGPGIKQD